MTVFLICTLLVKRRSWCDSCHVFFLICCTLLRSSIFRWLYVSQLRLEKLSSRHRYLESSDTLQINLLISVSKIRIGTRNDIIVPILNNCIRIIIFVLKDSSYTTILISALVIIEKLSNLTSCDYLMLNFFSYFRWYFTFRHLRITDILCLNGFDTCSRGAEVMLMWKTIHSNHVSSWEIDSWRSSIGASSEIENWRSWICVHEKRIATELSFQYLIFALTLLRQTSAERCSSTIDSFSIKLSYTCRYVSRKWPCLEARDRASMSIRDRTIVSTQYTRTAVLWYDVSLDARWIWYI